MRYAAQDHLYDTRVKKSAKFCSQSFADILTRANMSRQPFFATKRADCECLQDCWITQCEAIRIIVGGKRPFDAYIIYYGRIVLILWKIISE